MVIISVATLLFSIPAIANDKNTHDESHTDKHSVLIEHKSIDTEKSAKLWQVHHDPYYARAKENWGYRSHLKVINLHAQDYS